LPPLPSSFDPFQTLLWSDISFRQDSSVLLHIKIPKSSSPNGDFIDLFPFPDPRYCPTSFLKQLRANQLSLSSFQITLPVFRFSTQKNLTPSHLSSLLCSLLQPLHILGTYDSLSGHSFRAGIPSTLATLPQPPSEFKIKLWGRWTSEAYQQYLRLKTDQRRNIFLHLASHFLPLC
jgi:hypothetical protein